jgi:hypothetical protein
MARAPILRGGHSTYRLFLEPETRWAERRVQSLWQRLLDAGCRCEHASDRVVALDVPPTCDESLVEDVLREGAAELLWNYEEAHYGRPHRAKLA